MTYVLLTSYVIFIYSQLNDYYFFILFLCYGVGLLAFPLLSKWDVMAPKIHIHNLLHKGPPLMDCKWGIMAWKIHRKLMDFNTLT